MGGFACWCGYPLGRTAPERGTQYVMVLDEEADDLFFPEAGKPLPEYEGRPALTECPNCGRLHLERQGPGSPIVTYERAEDPPRVWADFSDTDALGRVQLRGDRSLREIAEQKLLFSPPIYLLLYDDEGNEARGEAHYGLTADDELDETLWAVTLDQA